MPSIPQSLLWISLVVLWLFVLVPMLISKRDNVRRTSDVALATRVLNGGGKSRRFKRSGPSAGHRHDPDWQPEQDQFDELDSDDETPSRTRTVVVVAAVTEEIESDYLDVDVVDEDSGALPVGGTARTAQVQPSLFDDAPAPVVSEPVAEVDEASDETEDEQADSVPASDDTDQFQAVTEDQPQDGTDDEYEYVEDTSGLEAEDEPATTVTPRASRPRRSESTTAAAVSARKYRFRKRMLMAMAAVMVVTATLSFTVSSDLWWVTGTAGTVTVLYLAYLRRQTRIEEQVRRRRQQRMARSRLGVENTEDREFDVVPSRLRRPGAAVLDIDDEDPIFEHLDEVAFARHFDLPRAAGQ
ncbi:divisome protein SepX/GlpR [Mycolicibacterium aichiense]|uniref:divisome protein SepX/GlpR n=1 Tax=Mycolicibacterium aichiense TaxID=1799 RepID=UPI003D666DBD